MFLFLTVKTQHYSVFRADPERKTLIVRRVRCLWKPALKICTIQFHFKKGQVVNVLGVGILLSLSGCILHMVSLLNFGCGLEPRVYQRPKTVHLSGGVLLLVVGQVIVLGAHDPQQRLNTSSYKQLKIPLPGQCSCPVDKSWHRYHIYLIIY